MSIPYSLALRLKRICSTDESFQKRKKELINYLTNRGYKTKFITKEIDKASTIPRHTALQQIDKPYNNRVPYVLTYNPALRQIPSIIKKYIPVLQSSTKCADVFPNPPLISYRRPKNLRDLLVRAKINDNNNINTNPAQNKPGSYKCHLSKCMTCPFIVTNTNAYTFSNTNQTRQISNKLSCATNNLIYMIQCQKCSTTEQPSDSQYIGQTGRTLRERFGEHRRDIIHKLTDKSGVAEHFNRPDHSLADVSLIPLETIRQRRESLRRARERQLITAAETLKPNGMNKTTDR